MLEHMYDITRVPEWNMVLNLLLDPKVSEIATNGPNNFYMKRAGKRVQITGLPRMSEQTYFDGIERGLVPYVKSQNVFNRESFIFEGRLEYKVNDTDVKGRCHIVLPPACDTPQVTIAKKTTSLLSLEAIAGAGSMSDEMRRFMTMLVKAQVTVAFSGQTGAGKAVTLDTKIATPTGWTTMGDVKVGDQVFDRFGNVVNVTHKFPQPARPVYEIEFSTGEKVYADAEHNWLVSSENSRTRNLNLMRNEAKRSRKTFLNGRTLHLIEETLKNTVDDKEMIKQADIKRLLGKKHVPVSVMKEFYDGQLLANKREVLEYLVEYGRTNKGDQRDKVEKLYDVLTTAELTENDKKWGVPLLSKAVEYTKQYDGIGFSVEDLPIHPYLLGLWLGDGSSRDPLLTSLYEDAVEYNQKLEKFGVGKNVLVQSEKDPFSWKITSEGFCKKLDALGVKIKHNGTGSLKRIPEMYLYADEESRRLLVAGLVDTDGWTGSNDTYFTNGNKELINGFRTLVHSLGYKSTVYNKKKVIGEKTHEWCEVRVPTFDVLAGLERKRKKSVDKKSLKVDHSLRNSERRIVSITLTDRVEEMACITVDGIDSTYLITESFIPTHNTTMLEAVAKHIEGGYRIGVAEDTPELALPQENVTYLHSTPWAPGMDPNNVATLDWVVAQFMRNRVDKLIIGETRGKEFGGFLKASNSGLDGCMTTIHAETPQSCLRKMTGFAMEARPGVSARSINMDIASAVKIIVQLIILPGGKHRVSHIEEITTTLSNNEDAQISTQPLYLYDRATDSFYKAGNMSDSLRDYCTIRGADVSEFLKSEVNKKVPSTGRIRTDEDDRVRREIATGLPTNMNTGGGRRLPTHPFGNNSGRRTI